MDAIVGAGVGASVILGLVVLSVLVAVLWIFLPFAVFGIKDLARSVIAEQKRTNALLAELTSKSNQSQPPTVERKNWE